MAKQILTISIEAIVVGALLVALYFAAKSMFPKTNEFALVFVVGAAFHLLFEITGLNVWYAKDYCKLLANQ
jgi:hypothetical protein